MGCASSVHYFAIILFQLVVETEIKNEHNYRDMHGGVLLSIGEVLEPRYRALDLEPLASEDCYIAILELTSTVKEDQRLYHVIVENDRGSDRRALMLKVDEPGQVNVAVVMLYRPILRETSNTLSKT